MKRFLCGMAVLLAFAGAGTPAFADPYKDESGHGRYEYEHMKVKGGERKEAYWDGHCKVERKWKKNGEYKEKRKCEAPRHHEHHHPPVYREPEVIVQPPAVVIQPPAVILR